MFVDEEGVYKISINTMREMEKKDENLIFLKEKLSLFIKVLGTPHSCVHACAKKCAVDRYIAEYRDGATHPLRSRGAHLHSH